MNEITSISPKQIDEILKGAHHNDDDNIDNNVDDVADIVKITDKILDEIVETHDAHDTFIDVFDILPADLPDIYGSIKGVTAADVEKLRKNNEVRVHYMKRSNNQLNAFENLIKQQILLNVELNQIDANTFVTDKTLKEFVHKHKKRLAGFTDDLENVTVLARQNRERYNHLKRIDDEIENDEHLKKLILNVNAACDMYKTVLKIIAGTQY